jgi:hypothetical protein
MTRKEENQLVALLKKLYGKDWQFTWKSEDSGFSLKLEVEKTQKETV